MKSVVAGLLCLAFVRLAGATSIVILRDSEHVYVGADSRRVYLQPGERTASSVCKIVPAGRLVFVASGLTFANSEQVADIGADVARSQSDPDRALEEFRARMQNFLPAAIIEQAKVQSYFSETRTGLILEAAFVGVMNGVPEVSVEWYRNNGDGFHPNVTSDRRSYGSAAPGHYDFIFLGKRRAIDGYLAGRSTSITGEESARRFIGDMIGLEIQESPQTTAPPIDILELSRTAGLRWLQCKAGCY